jgi:hypothetical protein
VGGHQIPFISFDEGSIYPTKGKFDYIYRNPSPQNIFLLCRPSGALLLRITREGRLAEETIQEKNLSLVAAVTQNDTEAVLGCLARGADIHHSDDLALRSAAYLGYLDVVSVLLDRGANVHADKEAALFTALKARDHAMTEKLLEKGASIKAMLDFRKTEVGPQDLRVLEEVKALGSKAVTERHAGEIKAKAQASKIKVFRP